MKRRHSITLTATVLTIAAAGLFIHTAVSRESAAMARRVASREPAKNNGDRAGNPMSSRFQALTGQERKAAVERRLRVVLSIGGSIDRTRALLWLMKDFQPGDFETALGVCRTVPADKQADEVKLLLAGWANVDPAAAMGFAGKDEWLVEQIVLAWVGRDGDAAVRWAREEAQGEQRRMVLATALTKISEKDPGRAVETMRELGSDDFWEPLLSMMEKRGGKSTEAIVAWADSLEDPAERLVAMKGIVRSWNAEKSPEQFAMFLKHPEELAKLNLQESFDRWAGSDPEGASAALGQLPAGRARNTAMRGLLPYLIENRRADAVPGIMALYPEDVDDRLISICANSTSLSDPRAAVEQAATIRDEAIRNNAYQGAITRWFETSPEAAYEWVEANHLPDEVVRQLESSPNYRRQVAKAGERVPVDRE